VETLNNWALLSIQGLTGTETLWLISMLILVIVALIIVIVVYLEVRKDRKLLNKIREEIRRTT
jgi:uncharacterized membrane protein